MAIHPNKRQPLGDILVRILRARQTQKWYFPETFRFWNFAAQGLPDPEVISEQLRAFEEFPPTSPAHELLNSHEHSPVTMICATVKYYKKKYIFMFLFIALKRK